MARHMQQRPQDSLVILDALTYAGRREFLKEAEEKGAMFIHGRIEDRALVWPLFERERFDWVVHFAAETHVDRSIDGSLVFIRSNVEGTLSLLDASKEFGVKRFHHISTDEVYGDFPLDSTEHFKESSPLRPSNPYSASKASSDLLALSYHRTHGLPVVISRCSNNYGPHQAEEKFIPTILRKALKDESIPVYGNGENIRDWLFVEDHCDAVLALLERGVPGQIYNISGHEERQNLEVVKLILKHLKKPETLISFVEDRKGHDLRYAISNDKLTAATGWSPQVSFEDGLERTIQWYKKRQTSL